MLKTVKKCTKLISTLGGVAVIVVNKGGFCKHQAFIKKHFLNSKEFPNCPVVNCNDRYNLALLALGDECPPKPFFEVMYTTIQNLPNT